MEKMPALMTVPEVAKYLRITKPDCYELINQGKIPYIKLSERRTRIPRDKFLEALENLKEG